MEHEAANTDQEISDIGNSKDGVMAIFVTALDSLICQVQEEKVG